MKKQDNHNIKTISTFDEKKNDNLPPEGWFKICSKCKDITSKYIIYNYYSNKYKIYICNDCKKNTNISNYIFFKYYSKLSKI